MIRTRIGRSTSRLSVHPLLDKPGRASRYALGGMGILPVLAEGRTGETPVAPKKTHPEGSPGKIEPLPARGSAYWCRHGAGDDAGAARRCGTASGGAGDLQAGHARGHAGLEAVDGQRALIVG